MYSLKEKRKVQLKKTAQKNITKSQDKQKGAYAKWVLKKYKSVLHNAGDEIFFLT